MAEALKCKAPKPCTCKECAHEKECRDAAMAYLREKKKPEKAMTPKQLQDWMDSKGWTKSKAARELGLGRARLDRYLDGSQPIPVYIELAVIALNHGAGERL